MEEKLKRIECDPKCGFMVQSHDEAEVLKIGRRHAKEKHGLNVSLEQLKGMLKLI
jgi:predicted small metal-binding protein